MPRLNQFGSQQQSATAVGSLTYVLLFLVLIAGFTLRVWQVNFDLGLGSRSHPDERSTSCFYATQVGLPSSWDEFWDPQQSPLNPLWDRNTQQRRSFTYGHYPLYLGVATGQVMHWLAPTAERLGVSETTVALMARADSSCDGLAVAGRLTIAIHDTLTILLLFLLGLRIFGQGAGLIAATFYAFTAQAIQLSHFFAMDPASTTYTVLAVLGGVMMFQERSLRAAIITGIGAGLAIASKFSALPVLAVPVTAAILVVWQEQLRSQATGERANARGQLYALLTLPFILVLAGVTFFITSPYSILDWDNFVQATLVEQGNMVRGLADFPFTRQYRNTTPYLYFLEQQMAWGLWWPLGIVTALGTLWALVLLLYSLVRLVLQTIFPALGRGTWVISGHQAGLVIVWSWVLPYFGLTGAFLAKFNRYMSPVLPFAVFFAAALIWTLWQGIRRERKTAISDEPWDMDPTRNTQHATYNTHYAFRWLTRPIATLLTVVGVAGGLFWSAAYVNGVYNEEHTWITASRWMAENAPSDAVVLCEQWDDCLPWDLPNEPEVNAANSQLRRIDWGPYEEDTAEKYEIMKAKLREADYVIYSSKRIYDSVDELPERYPMTTRYYNAMFNGELGFELAREVTTPPKLFGYTFDDRDADESWSLYDHAQVSIFRKVRDLSDAEYDAIFANSWVDAQHWYRGPDSPLSPLLNRLGLGNSPESAEQGLVNRIIGLLSDRSTDANMSDDERQSLATEQPLAEMPVVDNYRWNETASGSTLLAIVWWWLVVALLGWVAWPFAFWLFRPLRDRGYLLSRALGWLLAGWLLWWLASFELAMNTVWNSWLTVAVIALFGVAAAIKQWPAMRAFVRTNWGLLLAGEVLFLVAYLAFVQLRISNPDLWQLWFGGEKFMEFAMLNGILRSPYFPPVDPHFAGGIINYYYFGLYLVAFLIKLTGIYAEVAFNLAIPTLFALTVVNAFAVAYSAVRLPLVGRLRPVDAATAEIAAAERQDDVSTPEIDSPDIITTETAPTESSLVPSTSAPDSLDAEELMPDDKAGIDDELYSAEFEDKTSAQQEAVDQSTSRPVAEPLSHPVIEPSSHPLPWQYGFLTALLAPIFVTVIGNLDGLGQMLRNLANMGTSSFQSAVPAVETLVRAWSGLRIVLTTEQTLPTYDFWGPSRVIPETINEFPYWSFLFADLHPHLIGIPLAILFLALLLTLFQEFMSSATMRWHRGIFLLATFALMLGALASVNLWELPTYLGLGVLGLIVAQYRRSGRIHWGATIGMAVLYLAGAYLLFWPFFRSYVNVGASGVGFVDEGDSLGNWLAIWGFLGFIILSWLWYVATRPAAVDHSNASGALPAGSERWLAGVTTHFDRLPRFLALHRQLVKRPTLSYLLTSALLPLTFLAAVGAWLWGRNVLALCLLPLGLAWLLLWRRGRAADAGSLFTGLLAITGLAVLAGTQVIYLKDFLQGGDWYRMNTLFKFFSQIWVIWGVAAAVALPRIWQDFVRHGARRYLPWRLAWSTLVLLLFTAGFAYPLWGTPARLEMRFPTWKPEVGTLDGLEFMRQGQFDWPDPSNTFDLSNDWQSIKWLLANVRGNATIMESSQVGYYREAGSRIASMTGLSGITGMHQSEQRYGDVVGERGGKHREFWDTPDLGRMQQLIEELHVDLVYVGPLEHYLHPGGVERVQQLATAGFLTPLFTTEQSTIYAVTGRLGQTAQGYYVPTPEQLAVN